MTAQHEHSVLLGDIALHELIKEKQQKKFKCLMSVFIPDKDTVNFTSNFSDQNNSKSKYQCNNESIYIRHFKAVQKTGSRALSGVKIVGFASSF